MKLPSYFVTCIFWGFTSYRVEQKMSPTGSLFKMTSKKISRPFSINTLHPKSKTNQMGKMLFSSEIILSPHAQTTVPQGCKDYNSERQNIPLPFFHCFIASKICFSLYSTKQLVTIHSVTFNETPRCSQPCKAAPADRVWNTNIWQKCRNCKMDNVQSKERS